MPNRSNSSRIFYIRLANYGKKGGKNRAKRKKQIELVIKHCKCEPAQIGKKQVKAFFREQNYKPSTEKDYYYAICALWVLLDRTSKPPKPPAINTLNKNGRNPP